MELRGGFFEFVKKTDNREMVNRGEGKNRQRGNVCYAKSPPRETIKNAPGYFPMARRHWAA